MALTETQRGVLRGISTGAALTIFGLGVAVLWSPESLRPGLAIGERLTFALKWDALLAICLLWSIGSLARYRFFSPKDIDGGGLSPGTAQAHILQAILQNTLEQAVLGLLSHLLWAVTMPLSWQAAIPVAASLFLCGRILFIRGYGGGAPGRALGFAMTFYPTALMFLVAVISVLIGIVTQQ